MSPYTRQPCHRSIHRERSGMAPRLIPWAVVTIRLPAAWRNTSVNRTTGTAPEAMMSARTWPGPTEGSWSTSPTIRRAASSGREAGHGAS